jgi:hypothetical protein
LPCARRSIGARLEYNRGSSRCLTMQRKLSRTVCMQGLQLSRASINGVLKQYGLNGYKKTYKHWKFFRAKRPNELWQADRKGPYSVRGRRYWFFVCIDDYSRYLLIAEHLDLLLRAENSRDCSKNCHTRQRRQEDTDR